MRIASLLVSLYLLWGLNILLKYYAKTDTAYYLKDEGLIINFLFYTLAISTGPAFYVYGIYKSLTKSMKEGETNENNDKSDIKTSADRKE